MVTCFLPPARMDAVKRGLWSAGFRGVSLSEATGLGLRGRVEKEDEFVAGFAPRLRLEVACHDADLQRLLDLLVENARTGRVGDGKLFVTELTEVVRVRTGERGDAAL
jgi:nitrogen regulatory protein PII